MPDRMTNVAVLLAKAETVDGTDASPVIATNAVLVNEPLEPTGDFAFKSPRDKMVDGPSIQSYPPLAPKGREATWSNTMHVRGNNTTVAYSATVWPEIHPYIMAAGSASTVVLTGGAESYTYKPAATGLLGCTEYYYVDGKLYKILGAKADIDFAMDSGLAMVATVKRTGLYQAPTDVAVPTVVSSSYGTAVPPTADSVTMNLNFGGAFSTGVIRKFTCNIGNQIAKRPNANAAGGLATHRIRSRKVVWSVVLEDELVGTKDFESFHLNATPGTVSFTLGTVQYNKLTVTLANVRIETAAKSDDNGTQLITLSGGAYDSTAAANDAYAFLFN